MSEASRSSRPPAAPLVALLLVGLVAVAAMAPAAPAVLAGTTVLYDGSVAGQTLADQGFFYITRPSPPVAATAGYADGGTTLATMASSGDYAGYSIRPEAQLVLDRQAGFTLHFTLQLLGESHGGEDRAGLSVIVLAADQRGVELSFWEDEVWVQNDGADLFTHGEGAALDTTQQIAYALTIQGDSYSLTAGGVPVLEGALRLYNSSPIPVYSVPNYVWVGDNTSQAGADTRIFAVAIEGGEPLVSTPSTTATSTPTTTVTPSATPTVTPTVTPTPGGRAEALQFVNLPLLRR